MKKVILGKTGIEVPKNGFGALPIQRISEKEAVHLLQKALAHGMYYFDTARFYTDSEAKLGAAFHDRREQVVISSKTGATTVENFWKDLETSLRLMKTDYIDIYQFHNPAFCPKPDDGTGLYEAMLEARKQGKIRHIGISNHRLAVAKEAIDCGWYETLQFPLSYLSNVDDLELIKFCRRANVGLIAMKALAGGLITCAKAAFGFLDMFDNVVPIWGIQRESELDEFIGFQENPPDLTDELNHLIRKDREELAGNFCRGCGYCEPCPAGIEINNCNRMSLFLKRAPLSVYLTAEWAEKMKKIENCLHCGQCAKKCPYGLNTPELLQQNYEDFKKMWKY